MSEPSAKLKDALAQVHAPWDAARTERTLHALPATRRKKRVQKAIGGGLAATLLLGSGLWLVASLGGPASGARPGQPLAARTSVVETSQPPLTIDPKTDAQQLRLSDGSRVLLLNAHTDVSVERVSEQLVALRLGEGRARFEVSPRAERVFRVRTAQVTVEVLGTVFDVEQRVGRTWVQVTRGRVAVSWDNVREVLVAGDEGLFPRLAAESAESAESEEATEPSPTRRVARAARREERTEVRAVSWRDHAEGGDFQRAFPLLPGANTMASMNVSELMLAADAARLSGHPQAALPFLERVVEAHPGDARAPLASFTLGGVLMHQLGLPREAEAAYAKARATTKSAALAQDALARQVEAAHRAGDEALARQLAREYLDHYPDGRRVHAVRRFGRL